MRLRITLDADRPQFVPFSHQDLLAGLMYRLLGLSSANFAQFLHDEGYTIEGDAQKRRFKLFTFSTLRAPKYARRVTNRGIRFEPGLVDWYVSSPLTNFLTHSATGLLSEGGPLHVGQAAFTVKQIAAVPTPDFGEHARFICWTPIVAAIPSPDKRDTAYYLRPTDDPAVYSEAIRKNLVQKYILIHNTPPPDDRLTLAFDQTYLARSPHNGTKKITIHDIAIIGTEAPFTLSGSPDLIRLAWETGIGEKNSTGFGLIEATR